MMGEIISGLYSRYSRVEKALINAIVESYLQGVSTRRVQDIVSRLGIEGLSTSSVSRIAKELVLALRKNVAIDWTVKESARAKLRAIAAQIWLPA
ncbi:MAG: DUF3387 domain-containing protein [Methanothrix sp.]|nr:DUF3387 domain-containing protein [Methanothrix sp.]